MEPTGDASLPLYNSRIIDTYVKLLKRRYSHINISELLAHAGMQPDEVADQGQWFVQGQVDLFHDRIVQLTGNAGIAREAGRYAASPEVLGPMRQYVAWVMGVSNIFAFIGPYAAKLTRSSSYASKRIAANSVEVTVTPKPGINEKTFQCENRIGFFESIPYMFGHELPEISHPECMFKGGKICRYIVTWGKPASEIWNKVFFLSALSLFFLCLIFYFANPVVTLQYVIPFSTLTLLAVSLLSSSKSRKDLEKIIENHMESKEQLYDQISINYNNALMTNEIGQAISKETDRESILNRVMQIVEKRLTYDVGAIFLASEDKGSLNFHAGFGCPDQQLRLLKDTVLHLGRPAADCIFTSVFHRQMPMLLNASDRLGQDCGSGESTLAAAFGAGGVICCPIICESESLGILAVGSSRSKRALLDSDTSLMMGIAQIIGISINNSMRIAKEMMMHEQLRQAQKMELIGRLAGGISHDFNNLLTIIIGYSDILLKRFEADAPHFREVQGINNAGKRAADLTQQLLAYSRRQVLQPKVLDLNEIVADVSRMLRRLINEDIELIVTPGEKLWWIKADPGQMGQVIVNLALNGRDAMPEGGKLTIATGNVCLDQAFCRKHGFVKPGSHVMLTVRDTGHGMDELTKSRIFEPFFTTKQIGKGTGLGLATVYGIVKQSGGYIFVDSEPGHGATFSIYMPTADEAVRQESLSSIPVPHLRGTGTIVVAEDEDSVREFVCETLRNNGYDVLEAGDGAAALQLCRNSGEPVSLLLTDVIMPEMGGHELAREVNALLPEIKILFMSGYTDEAIVHHGVLKPGTAFIGKPFTPDGLIAEVRRVLDNP